MESITIKAYTKDSAQIDALKAFMKALHIKFEVSKETESPYNPDFVKKVKQADKEFAEGKGIKMAVSEFKELCK